MRLRREISLLVTIFLAIAANVAQAEYRHSILTNNRSGIKITFLSPLAVTPCLGHFPLRIEIINDSFDSGAWSLSAETRSMDTSYESLQYTAPEMRVPARETRTFDLLLPVPARGRYGAYLNGEISGSGVNSGYFSVPDAPWDGSKTSTRYIALSERISAALPLVQQAIIDKGFIFVGSTSVNTKLFPADWRAFSGLEVLWMTEGEWDELAEEQRRAINEWVLGGGQLRMVVKRLHSREFLKSQRGLGEIQVIEAADYAPEESAVINSAMGPTSLPLAVTNGRRWIETVELAKLIPSFEFMTGSVLILMLIYGVLVGPINLYFLAPKQNMFRLYVTTPLLALGTCIFILLAIFFKDGLGGNGYRVVAALIAPGESKALLFQEQVTRTGLLLRRGFEKPADTAIFPKLSGQRTLKVSPSQPSFSQNKTFSLTDSKVWGDWIGSRSIDAQTLLSVRPTRGELRLVGYESKEPVVISSFNTNLERVLLIDSAGQWWQTDSLPPGTKRKLTLTARVMNLQGPVPLPDSATVFSVLGAGLVAGPLTNFVISEFTKDPGFVALAGKDPDLVIETLSSIKWKDDRTVYFGPLVISPEAS